MPFKTILLLGALIALGPLSIDMYLPAFPAIEREFGAPSGSLQLTLATYFVGLALGQLFYGPLSDRFGRKPPLYFGVGLFVVAALGCALSVSVSQLAVWRFFQAVGGCACSVIAMAVIRDTVTGNEAARAISRLILVMGVAPILAPLLGGWLLTNFSWRFIFFLLVGAGIAALAAVHLKLEETRNPEHVAPLRMRSVLASYWGFFRDKTVIGYALTGACALTAVYAYIAGSPFVLIEIYGIEPQHFGWLFGSNAAGYIAGSQVNARLVRKYGAATILHRAVLAPAFMGGVLACFALAGWLPLPLLMLCFFSFLASLGFISPNSMAQALAKQGHRAGTAAAFMGFLQFTFATVAGVIMSLWHDGTVWPLACVMGVCGLSALLAERLLTPGKNAV